MRGILDNPYFQGYFVEFSAALLIGLAAFFYGRFFERKKRAKQFYEGIMPVLKTISMVCEDGKKMQTEDIRTIVRSLSKSFADVYLKDDSWLVLKNEVKREAGTPMLCGVCDDKISISQDLCPYCSLDCRSWDFAKIKSNVRNEAQNSSPSA